MKLKLIIILLLPYCLIAQQEFRILGTWKTCITKKRSEIKNCSGDAYSVTYTFLEDGTFSRYNSINGKEYINHGTWSYGGKFLVRNNINEKGIPSGEFEIKIKWINEKLFFMKGREGKFGPMYYHGFHKQ
ncbi:MAG: hypothetical protein GQ574_29335 [Crocinitomix sp.]|nr:hypothetical protein [Crocinitomix sp.]